MKKHILHATNRDTLGRKVKSLRAQGLVPGSVYGKKTKSASLSVKHDEFAKVFSEAGESGLIDLTIDGNVRPVLIHNVQVHPVTKAPLHVEFFQVDLKEKVHANVPLAQIGEAPAVAQKQGVLLSLLQEIEVEALPTDLPEKIDIDVSNLSAVDDEIKVSDIKAPPNVTILTDPGLPVCKISPLVTKEAEAQAAAEEAAKAAAAAESASQAEAVPRGEELPTEEKAPPEAPEEKKE